MTELLKLSAVEADIAGSRILRGVDLEVGSGEVVALMGRNGVGKTTTLRTITGLLPIKGGSVSFCGQRIDRMNPDQRARAGIGYVPQGRDIFPHLTVEENLEIGLVVRRASRASAREELDRVFELFPVLKQMLSRKGGVLSGGQQQQLAIGRALLTKPKLLILDEPTEGIQPSIIDQIGDTLKKLKLGGPRQYLLDQVSETQSRLRSIAAPEQVNLRLSQAVDRFDKEGPKPAVVQQLTSALEEAREATAEERIHEPIGHALKHLREERALAILLVEQFVDFCREVADRFYAMDRGAVVASGEISQLTDAVVKEHLQV